MQRPLLLFWLFIITVSVSAQEKPIVVLVSFDGFRWDYPARGFSPNITEMERNGASALMLKPCFPSKTFPNHISIITGMYPSGHGVIANRFTDQVTGELYNINDTNAVKNPRWYQGESIWETARRQGIRTASYFWPSSEIDESYRHPDVYEKYEHKRDYGTRVQAVLNWLSLPFEQRPRLITLYFDAVDTYGHNFGPESKEVNQAIAHVDSMLGLLRVGIAAAGLQDSVNIILVSDHGMAAVSKEREIDLGAVLAGTGAKMMDNGPVAFIKPAPGRVEEAYAALKKAERHFSVYRKHEIPESYKLANSPYVPELICIAETGWQLEDNTRAKKREYTSLGNHGFDNAALDMHGIFFAEGPAFKRGYKTGSLNNIDVYPLICEIFGIIPRPNIDGKLERISFLLKGR